MSVPDVMNMTLGEWVVINRAWHRAHGGDSGLRPPTDGEFESAIFGTMH